MYQDFNILVNSCILVYYKVDHCKKLFLYQDFNILGNYCKLREYIFHHHALEIFTRWKDDNGSLTVCICSRIAKEYSDPKSNYWARILCINMFGFVGGGI